MHEKTLNRIKLNCFNSNKLIFSTHTNTHDDKKHIFFTIECDQLKDIFAINNIINVLFTVKLNKMNV